MKILKLSLCIVVIGVLCGSRVVTPAYAGTYDNYVYQYLAPQGIPANASDLKAKLEAEVQRVLNAGHLVPFRGAYGEIMYGQTDPIEYYFYHTYDTIYTLSLAYPYLSTATQNSVKTYMQTEMTSYPLWSTSFLPLDTGTRRLPDQLTQAEFVGTGGYLPQYYPNRPKLFAMYALWLYAQNTGDWNYVNTNWTTIKSFYTANESETSKYYTSIAGAIGMARMAHQKPTPDSAMETTALNDVNTGMNAGLNFQTFGTTAENAYKFTFDWSVYATRDQTYMGFPFLDITPEIGKYAIDNPSLLSSMVGSPTDGPNVNSYSITRGEYFFPMWWMMRAPEDTAAYGEGWNAPMDIKNMLFSYHVFMKKDPPSVLRKYIDIPDGLGDYYWMQNVTRTVEASGTECWTDIRTNTATCNGGTPTPTPLPTFPVTGYVYVDTNGNGVKDAGEVNYTGSAATVTLSNGQTGQTDGSGNFSITSVQQGTYATMTLSVPNGYNASTPNPINGVVSSSTPATYVYGIKSASATPTPTPISANSEWTQFAHDPMHTDYTAQTVPTTWKYAWQWNGADSTGAPQANHLAVPDHSQPITGGGNVYMVATSGLYALKQVDGTNAWGPLTTLGTLNSTPVYDNGNLYVASTNGTLYMINATTGAVTNQFTADSALTLSPMLTGNTIYFVSANGTLYAIDKTSMTVMSGFTLYHAGSPGSTPVGYSPSKNTVVFLTQDLNVHAVNATTGAGIWKVKPTSRVYQCKSLPDSTDPCNVDASGAQAEGGWPVMAEQHGLVFIRYRIDWGGLMGFGNYPSTNAAVRTFLTSNPTQQVLYPLSLTDGHVVFTPAVGNGGEGDGGTIPMGPMPIIDVVGGQEIAYIQWRNGASCPGSCDGRWDTTMGEMVLDGTTVAGYGAGDLRFVQTQFFPTDETMQPTMSGNTYIISHWMIATPYTITNRSASLGGTYTNPILATNGEDMIWRESSTTGPSCTFDALHRYCANGLYSFGDTRQFGPGFYEYFNNSGGNAGSIPYAIVSSSLVLQKTGDGAIIALKNGNPLASGTSTQLVAQAQPQSQVLGAQTVNGVIPYTEAGKYVNQNITAEGVIASAVNHLPKAVYLGFKKPHDGALLVRVFRKDINKFSYDPMTLLGKKIKVTGKVTLYWPGEVDPEIIVTDPKQIQIEK